MTPTPSHILSLPPDMREAYRAIRNAGAFCPESARPLPALASCVLGWRYTRMAEAVAMLLGARYVRMATGGRVYVSEGPRSPQDPPRPIVPTSEHDAWPDALREAWAALTPPEQRLLLRARLLWRSWPNPGINPPRIQRRHEAFYVAHAGLYAQEYAYRVWSECRGADGVTVATPWAREGGKKGKVTPADMLATLGAHPDGLTVTELHDLSEGVTRVTLEKWLKHARAYGRARFESRGAAFVWFAVEVKA